MPGGEEEAEVAESEPPAQSDPSGRWTRVGLAQDVFRALLKLSVVLQHALLVRGLVSSSAEDCTKLPADTN